MLLRLDTPIRKVSWNALTRGVAARLRESGDVSKRSGVNGNVSASTQNQAFNALLFLYVYRRIRDRAEFSATTWMRPRSKRRSGQPLCVAGLRSEPAATRSGTASRRTRFRA